MRWLPPRSAPGRERLLVALPLIAVQAAIEPPDGTEALREEVVSWWRFDEPDADGVLDGATQQRDTLHGKAEHVPGVRGTALKLDGFRTYVRRERHVPGSPSNAFTLEAWVALAEVSVTTRDPIRSAPAFRRANLRRQRPGETMPDRGSPQDRRSSTC